MTLRLPLLSLLPLFLGLGAAFSPAAAQAAPSQKTESWRPGITEYSPCELRLLASYWKVDVDQAKKRVRKALDKGKRDRLLLELEAARAALKPSDPLPCSLAETRFTSQDAALLAGSWGVSVEQANERIIRAVLAGDRKSLNNELTAVRNSQTTTDTAAPTTTLVATVPLPTTPGMEVLRVTVAEGVEDDVHIFTPEASKFNGRTVLMLHGFPEYWGIWAPQIDPLVEAGFRVIIPDQRGYNTSTYLPRTDDGSNYPIPTLAADMFALLDAFGLQQVSLVGHDFGGAVSWWMAMDRPERFERMLIAGMPHLKVFFIAWEWYPPQKWNSRYVGGLLTKPWAIPMMRSFNGQGFAYTLRSGSNKGTWSCKKLKPFREAWTQGGCSRPNAASSMLNWYNGLETSHDTWLKHPKDFWPSEKGFVEVPTYVVDGSDDDYFVSQLLKPSVKMCKNPQSAGKIMQGLSHWMMWDDPQRFNQFVMLPWLIDGTVPSDEEAGTRDILDYDVEDDREIEL